MMRDPERIILGHSGQDAFKLMQSVSDDAPSAHARTRTLVGLGISATIAVSGKAVAATALVTTVKWVAMGAGVAFVALGLARGMVNFSSHAESAERTAVSKWAHDQPKNRPSVVNQGAEPIETTPHSDMADSLPPEVSPSERVSKPAQTAARAPELAHPATQLAKEVEALDLARRAALAHEPARVLALLDAYQREFPRGALRPEAQVLRLEALAASGQTDRARNLAHRLLNADPTGPLAERVRAAVPAAPIPESNVKIVRSKQTGSAISR